MLCAFFPGQHISEQKSDTALLKVMARFFPRYSCVIHMFKNYVTSYHLTFKWKWNISKKKHLKSSLAKLVRFKSYDWNFTQSYPVWSLAPASIREVNPYSQREKGDSQPSSCQSAQGRAHRKGVSEDDRMTKQGPLLGFHKGSLPFSLPAMPCPPERASAPKMQAERRCASSCADTRNAVPCPEPSLNPFFHSSPWAKMPTAWAKWSICNFH